MPGGRGGRRKGTPGEAYSNRTDLNQDYAPSSPAATPASGEAPPPMPSPSIYPEDVPRLDDPTARPAEPLTSGLEIGPGAGPAALPIPPADTTLNQLRAAFYVNPNPQLERVLRVVALREGKNG